jgi:predicted glycoside hydrolase/deacetylase ChbG (UPF0249 family)
MRRLILTADDFGASDGVNAAVERHHREGLLCRAGLMVDGPAAEGALRVAAANPALRVGLHLVLAEDGPGRAGLRWAVCPDARREMEGAVAGQFRRFAATGLPPAWWDGHFHLHMHPLAMRAAIRVAVAAGFRETRLVGAAGGGGWAAAAFAALSLHHARRLRAAGIRWAPRVFGLGITGAATTDAVERVLRRLPEGVSELYFHPGAEPEEWDYARLRRVIAEEGIELVASA